MKNIFTFLLVLLLFIPIAEAHDKDKDDKKTKHTIRFGSNTTNLRGSTSIGSSGSSLYLGYSSDRKVFPLVRLSTGLDFYNNKTSWSDANSLLYGIIYPELLEANKGVAMSYLSLKAGFQLKLGPFIPLAGIYGGSRLNGKVGDNDTKFSDDLNSAFSRFDWGFYSGLRLKVLMFGLEAHYRWGQQDVFQYFNNRQFQIGATFTF